MALTKKKPAKKRPAPKRKRKASPAQLAALARGRAKRKAKTGTTKKRKVTKSSSLPVKQEKKTMAKKRRSVATTTKRRRSVKSAFKGIGGKAKGMVPMMKDVAIAVAGGVGANVLANKLPIANPKLKAAMPLIAGILVSSVLGKKKPIFREIGHGMAVIGAIALLKQFAPNLPMLAGEDDTAYLTENYQGDMVQLGYDEEPDLMGDLLQLGDDQDEYVSPASM